MSQSQEQITFIPYESDVFTCTLSSPYGSKPG